MLYIFIFYAFTVSSSIALASQQQTDFAAASQLPNSPETTEPFIKLEKIDWRLTDRGRSIVTTCTLSNIQDKDGLVLYQNSNGDLMASQGDKTVKLERISNRRLDEKPSKVCLFSSSRTIMHKFGYVEILDNSSNGPTPTNSPGSLPSQQPASRKRARSPENP